jgi:hypothetical protein
VHLNRLIKDNDLNMMYVIGPGLQRAFPRWATLPSWRDLALGRRWHFFFAWLFVANLLAYFVAGIASGHLRRDLLPSQRERCAYDASIINSLRVSCALEVTNRQLRDGNLPPHYVEALNNPPQKRHATVLLHMKGHRMAAMNTA